MHTQCECFYSLLIAYVPHGFLLQDYIAVLCVFSFFNHAACVSPSHCVDLASLNSTR